MGYYFDVTTKRLVNTIVFRGSSLLFDLAYNPYFSRYLLQELYLPMGINLVTVYRKRVNGRMAWPDCISRPANRVRFCLTGCPGRQHGSCTSILTKMLRRASCAGFKCFRTKLCRRQCLFLGEKKRANQDWRLDFLLHGYYLFARSKWFENAHFRGSFSYRSLDSERYDAWPAQLAEPLIGLDGHPVGIVLKWDTHVLVCPDFRFS